MIANTGARRRGMLIDFDWAGNHCTTRYPATFDDILAWASSGIQRYGIMDKAHDIAMLNEFKNECRLI